MGIEINPRIYYAASTVPRTGKVRLLLWHTVKQSMALLEAHHISNIRDYHCRITRSKSIQKICEGFPGPPIPYLSHHIMCGLNFETQGALSTAAADLFTLSNLPVDAHPHPHA